MSADLRTVSPVVPELHGEIQRLLRQTWWGAERTLDVVARTHEGAVVSVALVRPDGTVAACARALTDGGARAMIHDVIVDEPDRGRGLGRAVVEALLALPSMAVESVALHCLPHQQPFYERLGFTPSTSDLRIMHRQPPPSQEVPDTY